MSVKELRKLTGKFYRDSFSSKNAGGVKRMRATMWGDTKIRRHDRFLMREALSSNME